MHGHSGLIVLIRNHNTGNFSLDTAELSGEITVTMLVILFYSLTRIHLIIKYIPLLNTLHCYDLILK